MRGDAVLDVAAREGDGVTLVLMVNLTNPMMMKGPIRRSYPVRGQRVRIALPDGRNGARARLLIGGQDLPLRFDGRHVEVEIPIIDLAEVVRVDWS